MTIDELTAYGANTEEGLKRCMNNADFYMRMVRMIPADPNFQKLYDAIDNGDLNTAFEAAHALKGSTGNLSLTPVYGPVSEMTELLRSRTEMDYAPFIDRIQKGRDALAQICAD